MKKCLNFQHIYLFHIYNPYLRVSFMGLLKNNVVDLFIYWDPDKNSDSSYLYEICAHNLQIASIPHL